MKKVFLWYCLLAAAFCGAEENNNAGSGTKDDNFLRKVHPYAFYLLIDEGKLADVEYGRKSVNATKYHINKQTNEVSGKERYYEKGWIGFREMEKDNPAKLHTDFSYRLYQKLTNPNYAIIETACNSGGSLTAKRYLLIKRSKQFYIDNGEIKTLDILSCDGEWSPTPPTENDIKKIEALIKQGKIGDIQLP